MFIGNLPPILVLVLYQLVPQTEDLDCRFSGISLAVLIVYNFVPVFYNMGLKQVAYFLYLEAQTIYRLMLVPEIVLSLNLITTACIATHVIRRPYFPYIYIIAYFWYLQYVRL